MKFFQKISIINGNTINKINKELRNISIETSYVYAPYIPLLTID